MTTASAGSLGGIAKVGVEKGYEALGDEGKEKVTSAVKGAVGKAIGGAAMSGLGSVANELLACNTILHATLGVMTEVRIFIIVLFKSCVCLLKILLRKDSSLVRASKGES